MMHRIPTITAIVLAATRYSGTPITASGARMERTRIEIALVGPVERCRDDPHKAPTIVATAAE
jgi:hypothetical protein